MIKDIFTNKNKIRWIIISSLILIAIYLFIPLPKKSFERKGKYAEDIKENVLYKVINIPDGDTLIARVGVHDVIVRLIGIDTPEVSDPRKPVQCYGVEASVEAKKILNGKEVYLEKEKTKGNYDIYGRVLAYVLLSDHSSYNKYMIEEGFAREYTFNKEKYKYQEQFKIAEKIAKKEKKGLWGRCGGK